MTTTTGDSPPSTPSPSTIVLIPAYNEGEVVACVIEEVRRQCSYPIVVIDDASTDDTILKAQGAGATVIPMAVQLGAWGAIQTGLRYAQRHGFTTAITMDADGQHDAAFIGCLLTPVTQGGANISIGACTRRGSFLRKAAWVMMKKTSGLSLEDITSGFRVYDRKAIRELASWRATLLDYQDIGVLLLLQSKGLKIVDVEVTMQPRLNGHSRIFHSWIMVIYYMSHTLLLGLTKRKLVHTHTGN